MIALCRDSDDLVCFTVQSEDEAGVERFFTFALTEDELEHLAAVARRLIEERVTQ